MGLVSSRVACSAAHLSSRTGNRGGERERDRGSMVEHAMKRISDYVEKSGIEINVSVAGSENCGE